MNLFKNRRRKSASTREFINAGGILDYGLRTYRGEDIAFFILKPTNLSVLSDDNIRSKVFALMNVFKGMTEVELICLDSRELLENNKLFLRSRAAAEEVPAIRNLLERDLQYLDRIQVQMATAREFLLVVRLRDKASKEIYPFLSRIEHMLREQGLKARRADADDIKRILAVYFEGNITTEHFEDFDGERWIVLNDQ